MFGYFRIDLAPLRRFVVRDTALKLHNALGLDCLTFKGILWSTSRGSPTLRPNFRRALFRIDRFRI